MCRGCSNMTGTSIDRRLNTLGCVCSVGLEGSLGTILTSIFCCEYSVGSRICVDLQFDSGSASVGEYTVGNKICFDLFFGHRGGTLAKSGSGIVIARDACD